MATEFEQLLKEQQKTNALLTEQGKPTKPIDSLRDNIAEIISSRRLAKQEEQFQKKEGIVKVDDNVAKGTKEVILQSQFFKEQIESLGDQDNLLTRQDEILIKQSAGISGMVAALREMISTSMFILNANEKLLENDDHSTKMFKNIIMKICNKI